MSDLTAEEVAALRSLARDGYYAGFTRDKLLALCDLAERAARAEATIERVRALAERWRYKGEHGWGPWQEGYGPSPEDDVLDHAAADLRRVLDNKGENGQ